MYQNKPGNVLDSVQNFELFNCIEQYICNELLTQQNRGSNFLKNLNDSFS